MRGGVHANNIANHHSRDLGAFPRELSTGWQYCVESQARGVGGPTGCAHLGPALPLLEHALVTQDTQIRCSDAPKSVSGTCTGLAWCLLS